MGDRQGQVLLGKYRLDAILGQGGMGAVYAGTNQRTGRRVAIKMLDERFLENTSIVQRFGREARAASAIEHPGIVEVLDLDQSEDGVPFLVMEYLDGETLARRIERQKRIPQAEVRDIFVPLLEALDAAHERGIVHRDIKPDNIFLLPGRGGGPRVKLLDFGISQKADEVRSHLTQTGAVLGTPHYMSPEQALGESALDARADIYAIGVVLYECVVGDVPYDAPNYNALLQTILRTTPRPPRERGALIDAALEDVIVAALAKDRDERPSTAAELQKRLTAALDGTPRRSSPSPSSSKVEARAPASPSVRPPTSWGDAPTLRGGDAAPRRPSPAPGMTPSLKPPASSLGPPAEAPRLPVPPRSAAAAARDLDELSGMGGPALELDHGSIGRPSHAPAEAAPVRGRTVSATFRSPSSSAIPAVTPVVDVSPQAPPSLPPPPSAPPPPLEARHAPTTSGRFAAVGPEAPPPVAKPKGPLIPPALRLPLAIVLAIVAVIVAIRFFVHPGPPPADTATNTPTTQPVTPVPPPDVAADLVAVDVAALPPGAIVRVDGLPAAMIPLRLRRGTHHVITITAPGYVQRTVEVTPNANATVNADLRPLLGGP